MKGMLQYIHGDTILHKAPPLLKLRRGSPAAAEAGAATL